jgi:hypothetical protein
VTLGSHEEALYILECGMSGGDDGSHAYYKTLEWMGSRRREV